MVTQVLEHVVFQHPAKRIIQHNTHNMTINGKNDFKFFHICANPLGSPDLHSVVHKCRIYANITLVVKHKHGVLVYPNDTHTRHTILSVWFEFSWTWHENSDQIVSILMNDIQKRLWHHWHCREVQNQKETWIDANINKIAVQCDTKVT